MFELIARRQSGLGAQPDARMSGCIIEPICVLPFQIQRYPLLTELGFIPRVQHYFISDLNRFGVVLVAVMRP